MKTKKKHKNGFFFVALKFVFTYSSSLQTISMSVLACKSNGTVLFENVVSGDILKGDEITVTIISNGNSSSIHYN